MRLIDADALKELFSEVIGHIAKKPEMNGNLEHMIRASAMVIQMIDDAPSIQLGTNLAEVGTDCIRRQAAIEVLRNRWLKTRNYEGIGEDIAEECEIYLKTLPSVQPDIIRCPDCYYNDGTAYCELHFRNVKAKDFCSWAERRE